ncbi:hypothetical protein FQA47_020303 [Oryzias melastigma]|uniref:Uncharacterized protein n=1 Tax=Oryzias melastigma TaxID=30732 RepID=A0A834FL22_ORYME|nr:hypothetical protein FQA47_020303 [Oryzias melastigma]
MTDKEGGGHKPKQNSIPFRALCHIKVQSVVYLQRRGGGITGWAWLSDQGFRGGGQRRRDSRDEIEPSYGQYEEQTSNVPFFLKIWVHVCPSPDQMILTRGGNKNAHMSF